MIARRGDRYITVVYDPAVKRKRHVGTFDTPEEAEIAESEARWRFSGPRVLDQRRPWRQVVRADDVDACEAAVLAGAQLVYFVQAVDGGPIKIGIATDPDGRLSELQTGSPSMLVLRRVMPGGRTKEAELHVTFNASRRWGEWFDPSADLLALADGLAESGRSTAVTRMTEDRDLWRQRAVELEAVLRAAKDAFGDVLG
jgi:hypothetical protein